MCGRRNSGSTSRTVISSSGRREAAARARWRADRAPCAPPIRTGSIRRITTSTSSSAARRAALTAATAIDLDLRATYAYLRYAWDLSHGTIDPEDVDPQWHAAPRTIDLHNALQTGLGENSIGESLARLAPHSPQYLGSEASARAVARQKQDAAAIEQIAMNMERWRWLPDDLGSAVHRWSTFPRSASTRSRTAGACST